jgi:hypothetical protein
MMGASPALGRAKVISVFFYHKGENAGWSDLDLVSA